MCGAGTPAREMQKDSEASGWTGQLKRRARTPDALQVAPLLMVRFRGQECSHHTVSARFGTISTVIFLIRLFFASIWLYNPARFILHSLKEPLHGG